MEMAMGTTLDKADPLYQWFDCFTFVDRRMDRDVAFGALT